MTKEDILFGMLKDSNETSSLRKRAILQKKYPDINISKLHNRIVNYQVKKYGYNLVEGATFLSYEEKNRRANLIRQRRHRYHEIKR